jgi:hypothetical protein
MILDRMHPEDVKAALRKRYGTIARFIEEYDLPATGVSDVFRGRTSERVRQAIEDVLREDRKSINLDVSVGGGDEAAETRSACFEHKQNEGV